MRREIIKEMYIKRGTLKGMRIKRGSSKVELYEGDP